MWVCEQVSSTVLNKKTKQQQIMNFITTFDMFGITPLLYTDYFWTMAAKQAESYAILHFVISADVEFLELVLNYSLRYKLSMITSNFQTFYLFNFCDLGII